MTDGEQHWKGIAKLIEELGEVQQLLGKAIAFPVEAHPDGLGTIRARLPLELADLKAAIKYFEDVNQLGADFMRMQEKLTKFHKWGLIGVLDMNQLSYNKTDEELAGEGGLK